MSHFFVELAKKAVENYIKNGEIIRPFDDLPKEVLSQKSGAFVTIMENGNLRGCIGTYLPTKNNVAKEIIYNAIAAATKDNRFEPIQEPHLPLLSFSVYVLDEPVPVNDLKDLDPKKYGVIVLANQKSGVLLPDLDGVDTAESQIAIACQKAGIDLKNEEISIYKFGAKKYQ